MPALSTGHRRSAFSTALLIVACFLAAVFFIQTDFDRRSFLGICPHKHRLLQAAGSPKVVIVGGSNASTGIDSAFLEKRLQRKVINMSTCIQLGLNYMMHEVEPDLQAGDTVVVIPEYEHWSQEQFFGTKYLLMLPALLPQSISWIAPGYFTSPSGVARLSADLTSILQKRIRLLAGQMEKKDPDTQSIFHCSGFNEREDYVAHLDLPKAAFDDRISALGDISHPDIEAVRLFNASTDRMLSRGTRVIVLPPVTTAAFVNDRRAQLDSFYKDAAANLHADVATDYERYALPQQYFFNCIYHVGRRGREIRTEQIARVLEQMLKTGRTHAGRSQ